ncbi:HNH endonuclease signature motif containing protein [Myceligenerans cantabricum]
MVRSALHGGVPPFPEVVLPEAPWGDPATEVGPHLDPEAIDTLMAQVRSSEPGPWLAGVLSSLTTPGATPSATPADADAAVLDRLGPADLAAVVAGAQRVAGWAQSLQARAGAALVAAQGGILGIDQAAAVVKDRLHVTVREGSAITNRADRCTRFPAVLAALEAGHVDVRKADTLLGAGAELTDDERDLAIEALLPEAPTRTWKWLSDQLNALAARLHGGGEELSQAAAGSNVWLESAGPGMALLTALLPAKDGARVFNAVQVGADQLLRGPGRARRRGQCRADALTSLVTGRMVPHPVDETSAEAEPGTGVTVPTTAPGVLVPPVLDTDLVPVPAEDDGVLSTVPAPTCAEVEAGVVVRGIEAPATVRVTVPATVLADPGDDTPGILDLLGPVPAETARQIAAEGLWYRLVTDPVTGILTDYSTTAYQPPPRLRTAIQARDGVCAHPHCDRTAERCDLDHIEPFDGDHTYRPGEPGQTRASNLHALCRKHHNLKTLAGWQVERDPVTGAETWASPTGHVEACRPDPVDPAARYPAIREIPARLGTGGLVPDLTVARPRTPRTGDVAERPSAHGDPPF